MATDTKAAHTPGPWHVYDRGIGFEVHAGKDCADGDGSECDAVNCGFRETFSEADARLIAAAPDLLEQLKYLRNYAQLIDLSAETVKRIDAAIAKAEGRS